MRAIRVVAVSVTVALAAAAAAWGTAWGSLKSNGVVLRAPAGWELVTPAESTVGDPRTVLVAGTTGTAARKSDCVVAAYRVPADGAVVVVLRWVGKAPDWLPDDRAALGELKLRREYFECFDGRGASTQIALKGRAYQVNLMVGDRATPRSVATALAVARSLDSAR